MWGGARVGRFAGVWVEITTSPHNPPSLPATTTTPVGCAQGLLNLSACEWGAPVSMSKPMFFGASDALRDGVVGLAAPNADLHDTWLGVEPISGQTLDFRFRLGVWSDPVPAA